MRTIPPIAVKLIFAFLFLFMSSESTAQSFITTWNTGNPGTSNATSITIPTSGAGYNYDIDWNNDGVFDEFGVVGDITHDLSLIHI